MTASGPFAMGPALAGNSTRRTIPQSNFTPVPIPGSGPSFGTSVIRSAAPSLKRQPERDREATIKAEEETYSEPDEGVEIIDMGDIRQMDWMAPDSLQKERHHKKVKKEEPSEIAGLSLFYSIPRATSKSSLISNRRN